MSDQTEETVTVPVGAQSSQEGETTVTPVEEAPWGYKANGEPYQRDPAIYAKRSAGRKSSTPRKSSGRSKGPDYTNDVLGLMQIVGLPLAAVGTATKNDTFLADAVAIEMHSKPIAEALNDCAQQDQRMAAVLERLGKVGPYGMVIASVAPLMVQVAANHGVIKGGLAGSVSKAELLGKLDDEVARIATEEQRYQDTPVTAWRADNA